MHVWVREKEHKEQDNLLILTFFYSFGRKWDNGKMQTEAAEENQLVPCEGPHFLEASFCWLSISTAAQTVQGHLGFLKAPISLFRSTMSGSRKETWPFGASQRKPFLSLPFVQMVIVVVTLFRSRKLYLFCCSSEQVLCENKQVLVGSWPQGWALDLLFSMWLTFPWKGVDWWKSCMAIILNM